MKTRILVLAMLLGTAGYANATAVCAGKSDAYAEGVVAGKFIKEAFNMNCSKNVFLNYDEDDFMVGVCAVSTKGKNKFGGSSEGGSVGNKGKCAAVDGCVVGDAKEDKATGCATATPKP